MMMDAWRRLCVTCSWQAVYADRGALQHAGEVHTWLQPGHTVAEIEFLPQGWVR